MRSYAPAFNSGETKEFYLDAKYFYLFEANNGVNIQFYKNGAPTDEYAVDIMAGYKNKPVSGFDKVVIQSSAAQTIRFFITAGEGGYDRSSGSVNVIGAVNTIEKISSYGASYRSTAILAANTPETIFSAAGNLNGAIILSAQFAEWCSSSSFGNGAFLAKATAPANASDGDVILGADNFSNTVVTTAATNDAGSLKNPILIPAGKGLYFITALAQSQSSRSVLYTLL